MKILDNIKSNAVSFFTNQTKILITIKSKIGSRIRSRWAKLGKYGQLTFLALLSCLLIVLSYYFIFPSIVLFLIKKATWELIFLFVLLLIVATKIISFTIESLYTLSKISRDFIRINLEFIEIFYVNTTKPLADKDANEHSFRVVDAILKYFGVIATLAAVIGFATSYISSQETAKTEREKMLNELFYKSIEQVGSPNTDVNLAGIYSLEQSAINFPRNQWRIVGLLANYIRQHPPNFNEEQLLGPLREEYKKGYEKKYKEKYPYKTINRELEKKLLKNEKNKISRNRKNNGRWLASYKKMDTRVQAALGVICRRELKYDKDLFESIRDKYNDIDTSRKDNILSYPDSSPNRIIDLSTSGDKLTIVSDLSNYDMIECDLYKVSLNRATLDSANMTNADLSKGYLIESSLISTNLVRADLEKSDLTGANLGLADLRQARMKETKIKMANLTRTNISDAYDLNKDQIKQACYWKDAIYTSQQIKDLEIDKEESIDHQQKCKDKWEKKK